MTGASGRGQQELGTIQLMGWRSCQATGAESELAQARSPGWHRARRAVCALVPLLLAFKGKDTNAQAALCVSSI